MTAARTPPDEAQRVAALHAYGILDTPVEPAFDDITRLAAHICGAPIAVINLIDRGRQWFKSEIGLGVRETPLDISICAHAILQPGLFVVPDTREDPRFRSNPLVTGAPHLRFYAGALLRTPDGHALGTVCVLDHEPRRLTEAQGAALQALARQTMAQFELHRALAAADRLGRRRGQLMTVAGHDLKQPLQTLAIVLDRLARRLTDAQSAQLVEEGHAAVERLSGDLDRLAQAGVAQEQAEPRPQAVEVGPLLAAVAEGWRLRAARDRIELKVVPSSARILAEAGQLEVILRNLVGNAVRYTRPGGRVVIGCRRRGDALALTVADNGVGIPQDKLAEIFEPFRQLDPGQAEGLGMGLAIVRQTAALLGLMVEARSTEGRGSVFEVLGPRAEAA